MLNFYNENASPYNYDNTILKHFNVVLRADEVDA